MLVMYDEIVTHDTGIEYGIINGNIGYQIIGDKGFGYDPIFIPIGYDVTLAQVSEDHKNSISHRGNASRLLVEYLKNN